MEQQKKEEGVGPGLARHHEGRAHVHTTPTRDKQRTTTQTRKKKKLANEQTRTTTKKAKHTRRHNQQYQQSKTLGARENKIREFILSLRRQITAKRIKTLMRFRKVALLRNSAIEQFFEKERKQKGWKWSTTTTYAGAVATLREALKEPLNKKWLQWLNREARVEKRRKIPPLRRKHVDKIKAFLRETKNPTHAAMLLTAIVFAWQFGQRISDVLQLHSADVEKITLQDKDYLVATFYRGKTIQMTGPFTIHVARGQGSNTLYDWLLRIRAVAMGGFLFTGRALCRPICADAKIPQTIRTIMATMILRLLRKIDTKLEARSIRRGGLQRLAEMGLPLEKIRQHFSKHKSVQTLGEYLQYFRFCTEQAEAHRHALSD